MIEQFIHGDCMDYLKNYPDNHFDLAIADPPYGGGSSVTRTGGTWAAKYGKRICEWDIAPNEDFFNELFRVSKNQIIWGATTFHFLRQGVSLCGAN